MITERIDSTDGMTRTDAERTVRKVTHYWHKHGHPSVEAWPIERGRNRDGKIIWGVESNLVNGMPQKAGAACVTRMSPSGVRATVWVRT